MTWEDFVFIGWLLFLAFIFGVAKGVDLARWNNRRAGWWWRQ